MAEISLKFKSLGILAALFLAAVNGGCVSRPANPPSDGVIGLNNVIFESFAKEEKSGDATTSLQKSDIYEPRTPQQWEATKNSFDPEKSPVTGYFAKKDIRHNPWEKEETLKSSMKTCMKKCAGIVLYTDSCPMYIIEDFDGDQKEGNVKVTRIMGAKGTITEVITFEKNFQTKVQRSRPIEDKPNQFLVLETDGAGKILSIKTETVEIGNGEKKVTPGGNADTWIEDSTDLVTPKSNEPIPLKAGDTIQALKVTKEPLYKSLNLPLKNAARGQRPFLGKTLQLLFQNMEKCLIEPSGDTGMKDIQANAILFKATHVDFHKEMDCLRPGDVVMNTGFLSTTSDFKSAEHYFKDHKNFFLHSSGWFEKSEGFEMTGKQLDKCVMVPDDDETLFTTNMCWKIVAIIEFDFMRVGGEFLLLVPLLKFIDGQVELAGLFHLTWYLPNSLTEKTPTAEELEKVKAPLLKFVAFVDVQIEDKLKKDLEADAKNEGAILKFYVAFVLLPAT
jgi:hypothetical protein